MKEKPLIFRLGIGVFVLLMLLFPYRAFSQNSSKKINGTVTDATTGNPLPGVNILVPGTTTGTTTNAQGKYTLDVPEETTQLRFSYVGYKTQSININGRTTINVALQPSSVGLEEVVVTALGVEQEKKSVSYSVSQVGDEALTAVPLTNPVNSLMGRVAGLNITQTTGGPGSASRVIIRGNTSLTGDNQPLYVIDGVPVDNSALGSGTGGGPYSHQNYGSGISSILNPANIKSITVLKGPNAAALYGSRAANGVIMITTKKGYQRKGIGVSYSGSFTWKTPAVLPDYQNKYGQGTLGQTYGKGDLQALKNHSGSWGAKFDGKNHLYFTGEMRPYVAQPSNVENFFRKGATFTNTLAFAGGSENSTYRFSYTRKKANSMLPNSGLTGHHFNLRATASLTDKLHVDGKVTYATQHTDHRPMQGTEGIMANLLDMPRNVRLADLKNYQNEDFTVRTYGEQTDGNPYWLLYHNINQNSKKSLLGFAKVSYDFTSNLSAFVRIGTDYTKQHIKEVKKYGYWLYPSGRFNRRTYSTTETNADFLIMYNKAFTDKFTMNVKFGGNHRYSTYRSMGIFGEDFKVPTLWTLGNASHLSPSVNPLREKIVNSLYGTAQFSYNETFFLNLSGRNDWSSSLPPDSWSYFYPSIGVSVLVNEFIDPNHEVLDMWKIRASWAQVGNDTAPYQLTNSYNLQKDAYLGLTIMTLPSLLLDQNLKPEQVTSFEVGTSVDLLNNRLHASFTYYHIDSENLIMDVPLTSGTSYSNFRTNVGLMTNKGIEVSLGGTPILTSDFSWDLSVNIAYNENELVELTEGLKQFTFTSTNDGDITVQATVGGGFGEIWGTTYRRTPKGKLLLDATGRPQATSERVLLGNYQPDYTGGFTNTFQYKNLSLSVLIDATIGGEMYVGTQAALDAAGVSQKTVQYRDGIVIDGVINKGTAKSPNYVKNDQELSGEEYWGAYSGIASNYVMDKTNIRLREASLSYSLPSELLAKTPIRAASIGVVGRNLFFFYRAMDNYDPESSFSTNQYGQGVLFFNLPTATQYGFHINIKF